MGEDQIWPEVRKKKWSYDFFFLNFVCYFILLLQYILKTWDFFQLDFVSDDSGMIQIKCGTGSVAFW